MQGPPLLTCVRGQALMLAGFSFSFFYPIVSTAAISLTYFFFTFFERPPSTGWVFALTRGLGGRHEMAKSPRYDDMKMIPYFFARWRWPES